MLLFVPNDPKSDLKLKVQTHNIKSQKYTKEGSNKPPWLNLTSKQVVFPRPFLLKAKKY
jgi:transcription initiation factor TFIIH subunit 1